MYIIIYNMFIYSPLEQFTIIPIYQINNNNIILLIILILIVLLFNNINSFYIRKHIEWWYRELKNIKDHIFIIISLFLLLFFSNILGMLPYSFTITAQLIFVLSISIVIFISLNILGIRIHKYNIFYLFLPSGVPIYLVPLIAILEFFLYFVKVISLTLRLCANMLAGHILIKILIYSFFSFPFLSVIILPIFYLELLVAALQSYIFVVLTISYYQDISASH